MLSSIVSLFFLVSLSSAQSPCLDSPMSKANVVTHYMIPLFETYNRFHCDQLEGTCIYKKNGVEMLHNYGYKDQVLADARCKNGYGNMNNCLHPCRVVAASMKHHRFGQILYLPALVGQRCGNGPRDGYEMVHDGYVVVMDTGSPRYFNKLGRFDFFWGRCKDNRNGICWEGAQDISTVTTQGPYCVVWDPRQPLKNEISRISFENLVRSEAVMRGDHLAASDFDLTKAIGRKFHEAAGRSQSRKSKDLREDTGEWTTVGN